MLATALGAPQSVAAPGPSSNPAGKPVAPTAPTLVLKGHTKGVFHVTFSHDGKRLATSSKDHTVRIWEAATGKELLVCKGHTSDVYSAAFSPDGTLLASAGEDHMVRIFDTATAKELRCLVGHTSDVYNVAFSPDGKVLASCSHDLSVRLWDPQTGKPIHKPLTGHTDRVLTVGFSPDGKRLVSSCATTGGSSDHGGEVRIWDVDNGQEIFSLPARNQGIVAVAFSPDGQRLAGACLKQTVKVWEVATGQEALLLPGHTQEVYHVAFRPDGRWLASCGGKWNENKAGEVKVWDLVTGGTLASLGGYKTTIWSLAFSPDGLRLATATGKWNQDEPGEVWIWDLAGLVVPEPRPAVLTSAQLEALWADLNDTDAPRAYRAVWTLSRVPEQSVPFLQRLAKAPIGHSIHERIPGLIRELDAEEYEVREKASAELEKMGQAAHPALRKAQQAGSPEVRRRATYLLERKAEAPPLSPEELRALRIIEVMRKVGTPETKPVLECLAAGSPHAPVTQMANAALEALAKRKN